MRILLIEDDSTTATAIERMLVAAGFNIYATGSGEDGLELGKLYDYDIILLDLTLPDMHGCDVLQQLRLNQARTPVLIITGSADLRSKLRSFELGADDYMTKPFHRDELVARIHAVVRRSKGQCQSVLYIGKLALNLHTKTVEVDDQPIFLSSTEFAALELLSLSVGTIVSKDTFMNHLYGGREEPDFKIVDTYISKLRKKLSRACGQDYITTVRSRGYVLAAPPDTSG